MYSALCDVAAPSTLELFVMEQHSAAQMVQVRPLWVGDSLNEAKKLKPRKTNTALTSLSSFFPFNSTRKPMHKTQGVEYSVEAGKYILRRSVLQWDPIPDSIVASLGLRRHDLAGCCATDAVTDRSDPGGAFVVIKRPSESRWRIIGRLLRGDSGEVVVDTDDFEIEASVRNAHDVDVSRNRLRKIKARIADHLPPMHPPNAAAATQSGVVDPAGPAIITATPTLATTATATTPVAEELPPPTKNDNYHPLLRVTIASLIDPV